MMHRIGLAAFAAIISFSGTAVAQTTSGDAGDPAVTEPGGTMGRDGAANIREGIRDREAVGVPRGTVVDDGRTGRGNSEVPPPRARL